MKQLALIFLLCALPASAVDQKAISLLWDRNPEAEVVGYRIYHGFSTRAYETVKDVGNEPGGYGIATLGRTNYFAVTAYDSNGLESGFSDEVTYFDGNPNQAIQFYLGLLPPKLVTVTNQFVVTPSNTNAVRAVMFTIQFRDTTTGLTTTLHHPVAEGTEGYITASGFLTNTPPRPFIQVRSKARSNVSIMPPAPKAVVKRKPAIVPSKGGMLK